MSEIRLEPAFVQQGIPIKQGVRCDAEDIAVSASTDRESKRSPA
jgi:hypothetical protein